MSKRILTALMMSAGIASSIITTPVKAQVPSFDGVTYSQINRDNSFNEPSDELKTIVAFAGLAIGTGVIGYHVSKAYRPSFASPIPKAENNGILGKVSPKLRKELLRLIQDRQTVNRLLKGTYKSHPGRSADWLAEKVIYDLKRDR